MSDLSLTVPQLRSCARAIALYRRLLDEKADLTSRLESITRRLDNTILMRAGAVEAGEEFKAHRSAKKIRAEFHDVRDLIRRVNSRLEKAEHDAKEARMWYLSAVSAEEFRAAEAEREDRLDSEADGL